jgi:hypothetical protein
MIPPNSLAAIERKLYAHLMLFAAASAVVGMVCGGVAMAGSAAMGVAGALAYYFLLGMQVRRQTALGRPSHLIVVIVSLLGRQIITMAAPALCFLWFGAAWWPSLITLIVARHWVMLIGWQVSQAPVVPAPQA